MRLAVPLGVVAGRPAHPFRLCDQRRFNQKRAILRWALYHGTRLYRAGDRGSHLLTEGLPASRPNFRKGTNDLLRRVLVD
jgi:hypothetical protein